MFEKKKYGRSNFCSTVEIVMVVDKSAESIGRQVNALHSAVQRVVGIVTRMEWLHVFGIHVENTVRIT